MKPEQLFSIVIPAYNEELNIKNLVEEIFIYLSKYNKYEIIFVDDASTDNSYNLINEIKDNHKKKNIKITLIKNKVNSGQSFSLKKGIQSAAYDTVVTLDCDGQNNPKDIPILLNEYFSKNNIFIIGGIRHNRKDSYLKIISSKIANSIRQIILNDNCSDTGCSLKVFDKKTFMKFPFFNGIHRFLPALFKGYNKDTSFINVDHRHRIHGISKYGTFDRLFRGIRDLIKVRKIIKDFSKNSD